MDLPKWALNTCRDGDSTAATGPGSASPQWDVLYNNQDFPCCSFWPLPLILSLCSSKGRCFCLLHNLLICSWDQLSDPTWTFCSLDWTNPALAASSYTSPVPLPWSLQWLDSLEFANIFLVLRSPKLDTLLQTFPHKCWREVCKHFLQACWLHLVTLPNMRLTSLSEGHEGQTADCSSAWGVLRPGLRKSSDQTDRASLITFTLEMSQCFTQQGFYKNDSIFHSANVASWLLQKAQLQLSWQGQVTS